MDSPPIVIAIGDSYSNGYTERTGDVPAMSAAAWLAVANEFALLRHSWAGYTTRQILDEFAPKVTGQYRLGVLTAGANDVVAADWDESRTAQNLQDLVATLTSHCEDVVAFGLHGAFARIPGVPANVRRRRERVDSILREALRDRGAFVDLSDFSGPRYIRHDQVHLTSIGYLEAADRAAQALGLSSPIGFSYLPRNPSPNVTTRVAFLRGRGRQTVRQVGKRLLGRF